MRIRIHFSKTGLACFISHTDLPMLFARAARRAGLVPVLTEGFTPRARVALAPPLPVGVVGMCEPADFWFESWSEEAYAAWRRTLPPGIDLLSARLIDFDGKSLSKLCAAASYRIECDASPEDVISPLSALGEDLLEIGPETTITVRDLERNGASRLVRILIEAGSVREWSDLRVTRTAIGGWDARERRVVGI